MKCVRRESEPFGPGALAASVAAAAVLSLTKARASRCTWKAAHWTLAAAASSPSRLATSGHAVYTPLSPTSGENTP